ncbi:uncharacterized protein [Chelonus insularis]|uniref:uncharacterized protein isoform X3 n=1 Tax=Chelonus insularis TaxID=460826 RepID=UPI00158B4F2F|nr:uncharacterized protein LOC118066577 isoform X3 [Chelonus insularis]
MMTEKSTKWAYVQLTTKEKYIVPVTNILKFNVANYNSKQQYYIIIDGATHKGIILFLKDSEEEVKQMIDGKRVPVPPSTIIRSASELSDMEPGTSSISNKKKVTTTLEVKNRSDNNNLEKKKNLLKVASMKRKNSEELPSNIEAKKATIVLKRHIVDQLKNDKVEKSVQRKNYIAKYTYGLEPIFLCTCSMFSALSDEFFYRLLNAKKLLPILNV